VFYIVIITTMLEYLLSVLPPSEWYDTIRCV